MKKILRLLQLLVGCALIAGAAYAIATQRGQLSRVGTHCGEGLEVYNERVEAMKMFGHEKLDNQLRMDRQAEARHSAKRASTTGQSRS